MTMTPEQEARVRELLSDAASILSANEQFVVPVVFNDVGGRIADALAALDGEGELEEWEAIVEAAAGHPTKPWSVVSMPGRHYVAEYLDEAAARRIGSLPKLERAAREVVAQWFGNCGDVYRSFDRHSDYSRYTEALRDLRAALNDEATP